MGTQIDSLEIVFSRALLLLDTLQTILLLLDNVRLGKVNWFENYRPFGLTGTLTLLLLPHIFILSPQLFQDSSWDPVSKKNYLQSFDDT